MSKKNSKLPVILGVAVWEAYRVYKGKGIFNKLRFKQQHEALCNYLETHYPDAFYSDIVEAEDGWSCIITDKERRIVIYMTKTDGGTFVFWEKEN
jgi:hypothetical protein